jgi:antitoxin component HigA of HigAB toxin-antitoxin module
MSSSSWREALERFDQMVEEARETSEYWVESAIIEFTMDVGRLMDEQGVSRAELARRLGTSRAYVTKLLGGNANFTLETMSKVATALGAAVHVHVAPRDAEVRWKDVPASVSASGSKRAPKKSTGQRTKER